MSCEIRGSSSKVVSSLRCNAPPTSNEEVYHPKLFYMRVKITVQFVVRVTVLEARESASARTPGTSTQQHDGQEWRVGGGLNAKGSLCHCTVNNGRLGLIATQCTVNSWKEKKTHCTYLTWLHRDHVTTCDTLHLPRSVRLF